MRRLALLAPLVVLLAPLGCPAPAPLDDGGVIDDAGAGECDGVTAEGFCEGDTLTYCDVDADEVITVDCADQLSPRDATCIEVNPTYGSDCAVAVGEDCLLDDGTILFCQGTDPGCLDSVTGFACTEDLGPCTEAEEGTCDGDLLLSVCVVDQPFVVDCASYGGACSEAEEACVMDAGELCDDVDFVCGPGLTCTDNECT